MVAYPGLDTVIAYDDNLFQSNANRKESSRTGLSPYLRIEGKTGPHAFDATLRVDEVRYQDSRADNYTDWSILGNANIVFSARASLKLRAEYRLGHDSRGSTDRPSGATPDEYSNAGLDGVFSYGAQGAQGRIEAEAGAFSRDYRTNLAVTAASNRNSTVVGGSFFWRIAPRTQLLFSGQQRNIDYQLSGSTLSSTERRFLLGAKWEATAKTSGTVKFGRLSKDFSSGSRADFSTNNSWDAGVRWSPLTYSVIDFFTSKSTAESSGVGDFILSRNYSATWTHAWNTRFSTALSGTRRQDDFQGTGGGRSDKTTSYGVKATYQWQRWMRLGTEFTRTERSSNNNLFNYDRDLILFTLGATL